MSDPDRIDLDDRDDEEDDEPDANPGDWLWRDDGDPDEEPSPTTTAEPHDADDPIPHVPRANRDRPAGIPTERGGAGAGTAENREPERTTPEASGPHGGGADDMTLAVTYRAAKRLSNPGVAFADAAQWADWVGIVGEVEAHVITAFQREHGIDADFFNGAGTEAAERLAGIDHHSMFYAERMVVVGLEDERAVAERAGWEFVPLAEAADEAGWARE